MAWFPGSAPPDYHVLRDAAGNESWAHKTTQVVGPVSVGRFTYIGTHGSIRAAAPVRIGHFTSIGNQFCLHGGENHQTRYTSTYRFHCLLGMPLGYPDVCEEKRSRTLIGSDVWIGDEVKVMTGLTLGDGCVVGARSLVTRDCEPFHIYGGVPARLIRPRFREEIVVQLLRIRWWDWPIDKVLRNASFFSLDLEQFVGDLTERVVD